MQRLSTRSQLAANASGRALRSRISSPACCQSDNPQGQLMCGNLPCMSDSELLNPASNQHGSNVPCSQVTQNGTELSRMKLSPRKPNVRKPFQQDLLESTPKREREPHYPSKKHKAGLTKALGKGEKAGGQRGENTRWLLKEAGSRQGLPQLSLEASALRGHPLPTPTEPSEPKAGRTEEEQRSCSQQHVPRCERPQRGAAG